MPSQPASSNDDARNRTSFAAFIGQPDVRIALAASPRLPVHLSNASTSGRQVAVDFVGLETRRAAQQSPCFAAHYEENGNCWGGLRMGECTPQRRPSRLARLMAYLILGVVLLHAGSCGLFFCVRLPHVSSSSYLPSFATSASVVADGVVIANPLPGINSAQAAGVRNRDIQKLIPRIIHQTYKTATIPAGLESFRRSWQEQHPKWQYRFYSDRDCLDFVEREFPEYLEAYRGLPKDVERSDFFRYMVVLRLGGVYADIDTEAKASLDDVIEPMDTMVVGWEAEVDSKQHALSRHFVRKRLALQWIFAAAPGHPVLRDLCDHIAANAGTRFSNATNFDTLERTGPGVWTDVVVKHALAHRSHKEGDPWRVKLLPRLAFGVHPKATDGIGPEEPGILVQHHFLGSWKKKHGWSASAWWKTLWSAVFNSAPDRGGTLDPEVIVKSQDADWFPVSIPFNPTFTAMVPPLGQGEPIGGLECGFAITQFGNYQPGLHPNRRPSMVEVLVGSLGGRRHKPALLDIGAGTGFFSLAAAARGHRVVATELAPISAGALNASIDFNSFDHLIRALPLAVRDRPGAALPLPQPGAQGPSPQRLDGRAASCAGSAANAAAAAAAAGSPTAALLQPLMRRVGHRHCCESAGGGCAATAGGSASSLQQMAQQMSPAFTEVDTARGYGLQLPELAEQAAEDEEALPASGPLSSTANRTVLCERDGASSSAPAGELPEAARVVALRDLFPREGAEKEERFGAVRVSVAGWEGAVLGGGLAALRQHRPASIMVELHPHKMQLLGSWLADQGYFAAAPAGRGSALPAAAAGHRPAGVAPGGPPPVAGGAAAPLQQLVSSSTALLDALYALGYTQMSHTGHVCDQRWANTTARLRGSGRIGSLRVAQGIQQPTWCRLAPPQFYLLQRSAHPSHPETVFMWLPPPSSSAAPDSSSASPQPRAGNADTAERNRSAPGSAAAPAEVRRRLYR